MSEKVIPSLSDLGWVTDSPTMLSLLLGYYILTDSAQSIAYQDNLINLPKTYYEFINDPNGMAVQVKDDMDKLLSRYFDGVDVETSVAAETESTYAVLLFASVIGNDGIRVSMGRVVNLDSSGVRKVIEVNNYGDGLNLLKSL